MLPEPNKKAKRSVPVDLMTRRKSALKRSKGTARGSRNCKTTSYAGTSLESIPKLLAASPTKMLTREPLSVLPSLVFSDLRIQQEQNPCDKFRNPRRKNMNENKKGMKLRNLNGIPDSESSDGEESGPVAPFVVRRDERGIQQVGSDSRCNQTASFRRRRRRLDLEDGIGRRRRIKGWRERKKFVAGK